MKMEVETGLVIVGVLMAIIIYLITSNKPLRDEARQSIPENETEKDKWKKATEKAS